MGCQLFGIIFAILTITTLVSAGVDQNDYQIQEFEKLPIVNATGPESVAFDIYGGGPYTGISDGRIVKWLPDKKHWIDFATTTPNRSGCEGLQDHDLTESRCGRTLGLSFNQKTGSLYIADAYMGLLVVSPNGGLATQLANEAQGVPFKFINDLAIDQNTGVIYFTDSSTRFSRRDYYLITQTGDKTGRLLKFDPKTNQVTVLLDNLMFANGVALSKNNDFLLVAETSNSRILKYWLDDPSKAGTFEIFAKLPGRPDNIKSNQEGEFWVAVNLPEDATNPFGSIVKLSQNGEILKILKAGSGKAWAFSSDVNELSENLWIGSLVQDYVAKLKMQS